MRSQLLGRLRRSIAWALVVALVATPQVTTLAQGTAGNVVIKGAVASAGDANPIGGARVYAVHLDTKQVFTSAPSGGKGEYQITGLPFGYYDLAVETPQGLYLANRVINAPAGEEVQISLVLGPPQPEDTEWWSAEPDRRIPGLDRVPDGVARIVEGRPTRDRLIAARPPARAPSPAGAGAGGTGAGAGAGIGSASWLIPVLAAVGVVGLAVLIDDQDDEDEEFPATPF